MGFSLGAARSRRAWKLGLMVTEQNMASSSDVATVFTLSSSRMSAAVSRAAASTPASRLTTVSVERG